MSTAEKLDLISVDDYLAGELASPIKHEYLGGVVHAMAGATAVEEVYTRSSRGKSPIVRRFRHLGGAR